MKASKNIMLMGTPFAYIVPIVDEAQGTLGTAIKYANLESSSYKLPKPEDAASTAENIDINRADNAIIRFPKQSPTISGVDGLLVNSATTGTSTKMGEITLTMNEVDEDATSWTEGINHIKNNVIGKLCLVVIATGFSYDDWNSATKNVDGWAYMLGRVTNDLESQMAAVLKPINYYLGEAVDATITAPAVSAPVATNILAGNLSIVPTAAARV